MSSAISDELRGFLMDEPRVAKIATIRKSGSPWLQPVWFTLDGEEPILVVTGESIAGRSLRRDPRLAFCVDDIELPYAFATLEGRVETSRDPEQVARWMREMLVRYRPEIRDVDAHLHDLMSSSATVCRLKVERIYFEPSVGVEAAKRTD